MQQMRNKKVRALFPVSLSRDDESAKIRQEAKFLFFFFFFFFFVIRCTVLIIGIVFTLFHWSL